MQWAFVRPAVAELRIVQAEGVKLLATEPTGKVIPSARCLRYAIGYTLREMLQKETRMTVLGACGGESPRQPDAVGGGSYRPGRTATVWPHGLLKSWQNGCGVAQRGLGENEIHRSGLRNRACRGSDLRGW